MRFNNLSVSEQLVEAIKHIYNGRMTTLSGGNLSIKDDEGNIWITPAGIDKGNLTPDDIMCAKADGAIIGKHRLSTEFPFHKHIYEMRPDLNAIVHAHPPGLVSFSLVGEVPSTDILPSLKNICKKIGFAAYALPGSQKLGTNIAEKFGEGFNTVLLENHGAVTASDNLINALTQLETLEFGCRALIQAKKLGEISLAEFEENSLEFNNTDTLESHGTQKLELKKSLIQILQRACKNMLIYGVSGDISVRINENSFIATPADGFRKYLEIEDLVHINIGAAADQRLLLHSEIYKQNKDMNCIITAQPPNVTAFAITDKQFDTRTIPESYIVLRSISKIDKNTQRDYKLIAEKINSLSPVALLQNNFLITSGRSIIEAFDRLEVAEFSAKSYIDALSIGEVSPIGNKEIDEIISAFLLPNR